VGVSEEKVRCAATVLKHVIFKNLPWPIRPTLSSVDATKPPRLLSGVQESSAASSFSRPCCASVI
jgi:hypothetical protein